jgi:hypothetical protein
MFAVPPTYGLKLTDDMSRDELQFVVRQLAGLLADAERRRPIEAAQAALLALDQERAEWL